MLVLYISNDGNDGIVSNVSNDDGNAIWLFDISPGWR